MSRHKHTTEEIINKLREAEVLQAKGMSKRRSDATTRRERCNVLQVAEGVWWTEN